MGARTLDVAVARHGGERVSQGLIVQTGVHRSIIFGEVFGLSGAASANPGMLTAFGSPAAPPGAQTCQFAPHRDRYTSLRSEASRRTG